jgi:acetyl-CoA carboxylase carboxyl transferase subunit alpha
MKARAANALKPTAPEMLGLGLIDEVVAEPPGGAHTDPAAAATLLGDALQRHLDELKRLSAEQLCAQRYQRLRTLGGFFTPSA